MSATPNLDVPPSRVFTQRFHDLQQTQDSSAQIIKELIAYCEHMEKTSQVEIQRLGQEIDNLKLDLADATRSRREFQTQANLFSSQFNKLYQDYDNFKNRNPYIAILIDGDGLIFKDEYIKAGIEGGKKAAYALRNAVAKQCEGHAHEIEISAKIVANLSGLARAMTRDGITENVNELKDFMLGFTQAKASFDFVDVGYGKERADSKIKETTRWHLQNHNCRQILLGVSHDAGYAPFLDEILKDDTTRKRITVLEGVSTVRDITSTGVHVFKLDDGLFRADKLVDRNSISSPSQGGANGTAGSGSAAAAVASSSSPNSNISSAVPSTASPFSTFAQAIAKVKPASPPPQVTLPLAPRSANAGKKAQQSSKSKWKPGPRGLDKTISVNQVILETVKRRKDNNKLCNNHFLRGPCSKGDSCTFVHHYKPSADELDAIAFLSRLNPCTSGQDCDADDCIYGHHCPNVREGTCTHPYCKFPKDAHPPDTKFKNANVDKNF